MRPKERWERQSSPQERHQYHPHLEHEFKHYILSYNQGYSQKPSIFLVSIYDVCGRLQNILN